MNGTEIEPQSQGQTSDLARILDFVGELLSTARDPAAGRKARDFTRDGTLTPDLMVVLLLFMAADGNRRGYRHVLDAFWDQCTTHGVPLPTAEPVCLPRRSARRAASCPATCSVAFCTKRRPRWRPRSAARRAGTGAECSPSTAARSNLQRSSELDFSFGRPDGGHVPQATVSALVNVTSGIPNDIVIDRYGACERQMLIEHLEVLRRRDVLVLDRGYPSHEILRILRDRGVDFLVRVPATNTFEAIETFRASGGNDYRVIIPPAKDTRRGDQPIEVRALKLKSPSGEESFYLTSLRRSQVSRKQIAELYRLRWQAEELFKLEKSAYFDQRQFHAKSAHGVRQEILAQAIYVVIARFLQAASARYVGASYRALTVKSAVLALADYLTRLCLKDPERAIHMLPRLMERIARARDKRRPGRSCPRRSFKPGPRWGPNGRRGA